MFNSTHEFEATVLVRGKPVTEVVHNGQTFIEGRKKSSYELYFRNNTHDRVLVVPSVDGLSVIDGSPAGKHSPGYIIDAHDDVTIPGWTISDEEAAAFEFNSQGSRKASKKTYVEATGQDPQHQGAIGFLVFRERPILKTRRGPVRAYHAAMPGRTKSAMGDSVDWQRAAYSHTIGASVEDGSAMSWTTTTTSDPVDSLGNVPNNAAVEASLGTGFGASVDFETLKVDFKREATHCAVFAFFYDTLKNLRKAGVPVEQFNVHYSETYETGPNPFPDSPEVTGYAKPPKGWTGSGRKYRKTRR